jgi:hypothetical protein
VESGECVNTLTPIRGGWVKIVCFYPDGSSISSTARSEAVDEVPWWNIRHMGVLHSYEIGKKDPMKKLG